MNFKMCCPTLFGLEGLVADELRFQGKLTTVQAENGRVFFTGDEHTLAWANLNLRCAERVLLVVGTFPAATFDMLFEGVRALPWEQFIPQDGAFPVKGHSLQSALHSIPDCQRIIKKAVAERLKSVYGDAWLDETGAKYQIQFAIMQDKAELYLDSSGAGLHKRGYRANANVAPLRETLAAALLKLTRWRGQELLIDPFCGSGTIPIEAALIAQRRAPGLQRSFAAEQWSCWETSVWRQAREAALDAIDRSPLGVGSSASLGLIQGSDIDAACVALAHENARKAGVDSCIVWKQQDATRSLYAEPGVLCANPPYGERMLDHRAAEAIYTILGKRLRNSPLKQYLLSSDPEFERCYGRKADKRRKLYNGMIPCNAYMYFRHAPKRRSERKKDREE